MLLMKSQIMITDNHRSKAITYASGLRCDWNDHAADSKKSLYSNINISFGGLEDEEANAVNPYLPQRDDQSKATKKVLEAGK
jgi:hypothetical protein